MRPNRLMALIAANKSRPRRFEVRQEADSSSTIYLYDVIDPFWGVSAASFVKALNSISTPKIELHINSPGGDVFDGRAIASAIAAHPSQVTAHVDGYAASAASIVAIAAKQVVMAPGSFLMIHNAWTFTYGNAAELRTTADLLDKIDGSLIEDYVRASGASAEQVKAWMDAETWFTAQEAVDAGLADSVAETADPDEGVNDSWDLSVYGRAPTRKDPPEIEPAVDIAALDAAHSERAARLRRVSFS
jgi:ATP-dependent Clp protease protease subunit